MRKFTLLNGEEIRIDTNKVSVIKECELYRDGRRIEYLVLNVYGVEYSIECDLRRYRDIIRMGQLDC